MKKVITVVLCISLLFMTACKGNEVEKPEKPENSVETANSQLAEENNTSESDDASQPEEIHTLSEFIEIDVDKVIDFEHAFIFQGPSIVEIITTFTQQEAKDMAVQLSQLVVSDEGNIADKAQSGGSVIRYTLNFIDDSEPLVIYFAGTFSVGSIKTTPICYIDSVYYHDTLTAPDVVDIEFPKNYKSTIYDIVGGKRVARPN